MKILKISKYSKKQIVNLKVELQKNLITNFTLAAALTLSFRRYRPNAFVKNRIVVFNTGMFVFGSVAFFTMLCGTPQFFVSISPIFEELIYSENPIFLAKIKASYLNHKKFYWNDELNVFKFLLKEEKLNPWLLTQKSYFFDDEAYNKMTQDLIEKMKIEENVKDEVGKLTEKTNNKNQQNN